MSRPLVLVGAGEFALIALEYFEHDSDYEVIAFSIERAYITQPVLEGRPVIPYEDLDAVHPLLTWNCSSPFRPRASIGYAQGFTRTASEEGTGLPAMSAAGPSYGAMHA